MSGAETTSRYVEQIMGLPVSLALRGTHRDDQAARDAWAAVVASLRWVDEVFSTYRTGSWISRLGRGEVALEACPTEVADVLELGERARQESDGAFDVRRRDPSGHVTLDPSGVVKGWAVERAAVHLAGLEDTDWCLSAAGDMVCHVARPEDPAWQVGVEHPLEPGRIIAVVPVRRGAVATSGPAHRGAHIVDPRTGAAPAALASVTVVADSLTWADIDATAAFVLGDRGVDWLGSRGRVGVVVTRDGAATTYGRKSARGPLTTSRHRRRLSG